MTRTRALALVAATAAALASSLAAVPALAQNYGTGDQVLTVGALEFRPVFGTTPFSYSGESGYLSTDSAAFRAPVKLPDGAEITQLCVYANIPDNASFVSATLYAMKLAPGGLQPGIVAVPGAVVSDNVPIGYGVVCTDPISYIVHSTADVDGDDQIEHVAHYIQAQINAGGIGAGGLGGVRITWRRSVSPPPGAATFGDVPASDGAYAFVEALAASGISAGCGNGNYCPDSPLTRRQMAVFLAKALGLHWPL